MQIKDKTLLLILLFLSFFSMNSVLNAEEFNISAKEIKIDKENETIEGIGSVQATDIEGKIINADKIFYEKSKKFLLAEGNVTIADMEGNILKTDKATYDKKNELIITYNNTEMILKEGYSLVSSNINYNVEKKILISDQNSLFSDVDGNIVETSMFQYDISKNLFSSLGDIKIRDINKNKYFFKEIHVDTKTKEIIGSEVSAILDQESFGLSKKSDPRFAANDILLSKNLTVLSKGVFTVCQKRAEKCPPWTLKAKKITHDQAKKNIYYEHATLKVYDIPLFYFPKFFHPDPTVKRQSGFLAPFFTNTTAVGTGFAQPYYWAISNEKDLTFTPKVYANENFLFLNEYRQAFKNGFFILDTSYTEGYKNTTSKKTEGPKNHIFANLDLNLTSNESHESNLSIKVQRTSNNTYFRNHSINTSLVDSESTTLENKFRYSFFKEDMYFDISTEIYQDLRVKKNSDQYEYILPNILYGKTFFSEKFGAINIKSNAFHNQYGTNVQKTMLTNDVVWNPSSYITKNGFISTLEGMIRNTNYETKKTIHSKKKFEKYKDGDVVNEINAVVANKISLPMKKEGVNYSNFFSPNFMIRYAPGHMRNLDGKDLLLNHTNLYALNKTSEIEDGLSAILGFDFKLNQKEKNNTEKEKLSISLGQVFNSNKNKDIPSKSSLDQRMSDIVGKINYNFSEIGEIDYKFSVDNNINDINYSEISSILNFGKVQFNLDYLEEQNHIGNEHYVSPGITLNFNDQNKLSLSTKKNFKTDSTEFYDLSYQYEVDCLRAGVVYRREFYQDSDLEPNNTLMFTLTFIPFGNINTPALNQ